MSESMKKIEPVVAMAVAALLIAASIAVAVPLQNVYAGGEDGEDGGDGGDGGEGCTPGFWKNHPEAWEATGYSPDQQFSDVFGFEVPGHEDLTLFEALSLSGTGEYSLIRHGVAGLLNAAHPDVNYRYSESTVISKVQDGADPIWTTIFPGNDIDWEERKNELEAANELVCPL
jgi:hypothetical protein